MQNAQRGADSVSLLCGSTLLALALGSLMTGTAQADLAAELDRLSQVRVADFGRDALVREYGKALVRHPDDPARSAGLLAMGHLCEIHDPAHGARTDEDRARRYFRAAISAAPVGTEPWLNACLTSFSRELWRDTHLARQQLADLEQQFAHVNYYDPDWRRVAAVRVAAARVDYATCREDVFAAIDAFQTVRGYERSMRPPQDPLRYGEIIDAQQRTWSAVLNKIVHCDLPKARRRELLKPLEGYRAQLWFEFQEASKTLDSLPEPRPSVAEEPSAL
jgi:hypothetical protein